MTDLILAVDLGAGSLRTGAVGLRGRVLAAAAAKLASDEPKQGWSEIDPERWWRALRVTVTRVLGHLPRGSRIAGVCLAGLTRTQVLLDQEGRVLAPAMLFRDRRAEGIASVIARHFPTDNPADAISAFHPLARLAWVARERPALFRRVAGVLEPKDFLNFRLAGIPAGDSVTCSRLDAMHPTDLPDDLNRCRALLDLPLRAPWASLGPLACREPPFDRLQGVPVFAGSMDSWASAVGAGAVRAGQAYDCAGTSEVVGLVVPGRVTASGLVSLAWTEDVGQIGGPTQAGADCALWCHEVFRVPGSLATAVERAGKRTPHADRPIFLPYLAGERTPVWRSDVRGAFYGVGRAHGPDDFLWAVLEGVALAGRDILAAAEAGAGIQALELRIAGGGARSDAWCQIKADVIGRPVLRPAESESGLIGAAIAAATGLGRYSTVARAADAMVKIAKTFKPRARHAELFARRAEQYGVMKRTALGL